MADEDREYQRERARSRLQILDGLLRAIEAGWPLVEAIETASDRKEAERRLTGPPFSFAEWEALHVLDMPLGLRTADGRRRIAEEKADLERFLSEL